VIENRGRRVLVQGGGEERVCFLSGKRAVVGDEVTFVEARGGGGKLTGVAPRRTQLVRVGHNGREQVLAANLEGLFVVAAPSEPPFRPGLVDRYAVAAAAQGLRVCVVLNKCDQGVPEDVEAALALRMAHGLPVLRASALLNHGLDALRAHVARHDDGPWALVGHSGVGKTSLLRSLFPGIDVGPVGDLSSYWGTGQHTTTATRLFALPDGGELLDSPGIRTFTPGGLTVDTVRRHFPGLPQGACRYRDCQHRSDEDGCALPEAVAPELLESYRRLLEDVRSIGGKRSTSRRQGRVT
jgi:ribosome biogenesis GTPase